MLILTIRTDKPEAEIGLYENMEQLAYKTWTAHRQLAETLHGKVHDLLENQGHSVQDIQAVACYAGPGSFTGLRIGLTIGNTLAYGLAVPIIAATGNEWQQEAIGRLLKGESEPLALPYYGAEVHITQPRR